MYRYLTQSSWFQPTLGRNFIDMQSLGMSTENLDHICGYDSAKARRDMELYRAMVSEMMH
jgi:hypothetical protein